MLAVTPSKGLFDVVTSATLNRFEPTGELDDFAYFGTFEGLYKTNGDFTERVAPGGIYEIWGSTDEYLYYSIGEGPASNLWRTNGEDSEKVIESITVLGGGVVNNEMLFSWYDDSHSDPHGMYRVSGDQLTKIHDEIGWDFASFADGAVFKCRLQEHCFTDALSVSVVSNQSGSYYDGSFRYVPEAQLTEFQGDIYGGALEGLFVITAPVPEPCSATLLGVAFALVPFFRSRSRTCTP